MILLYFAFQSSFMKQQSQQDLQHIRAMMERSARVLSLSGLSGIIAGILAIISGLIASNWIESSYDGTGMSPEDLRKNLVILAFITLVSSITVAAIFSIQKSKKNNLPLWTNSVKKLFFNFSVPLLAGFICCLAFYHHGNYAYIAASTLLFYGLALLNASYFTYKDIKYLGICEIGLGLIGMFAWNFGLELWILGFGLLHIIYGIILYRKYG